MPRNELLKLKLASRRAFVKVLRKRRLPKPVPLRFPREAILLYRKELLLFTKHLKESVLGKIESKLKSLFPETPRVDGNFRTDAANKDLEKLVVGFKANTSYTTSLAKRVSKRIASQVDVVNKAETARQFKTLLGVDMGAALNPKVSARLNEFIAENVTLIKSIETRYLADIQATLEESFAKGRHVSQVMELIKERGDVSDARAELIARDQVAKLNGQLTRDRQQGLGIKKYTWATSNDDRVRDAHKELNNKEFSWDDPPLEGHPGEAVNCRCNALPILDDLLGDLPETKFIG